MAIKFNVLEIGKPGDPDAPKKFYPRPVHSGEITLENLATDISYSSSLTESDIYAVLQSLVREIPRNISQGYIVRLGNLGSFRLSWSSEGSEVADDVTSGNITSRRLLFSPGKQVALQLEGLTFKKNQ